MKSPKKYQVLGLMSGTSLDGLDLALVEFTAGNPWSFRLREASTLAYSRDWEKHLETAHQLSGPDLINLHHAYGSFLGQACVKFLKQRRIRRVDLIASHGHTIFHQPQNGFTFQLGDGSAIHAITGIPVVYDFRSLDVELGGEGAPLVPMGDRHLFSAADVCLNLGGIANLSMEVNRQRKAFDICFCNMALNHLMKEIGKPFDHNGRAASRGKVNAELLAKLDLAYRAVRKKRLSLGREYFESAIRPLLDKDEIHHADRLRTVCESVAMEIGKAVPKSTKRLQLMVTGGGARNGFLVELLQRQLTYRATVVLPSDDIIDFKEAIIFAFLGVLRLRNEVNVLSSVTRASRDSCSGVLVGI